METSYRVVLDTNFIMVPFQFGVDIASELDRTLGFKYELCTTDSVMRELMLLSREKGRDGRAAKASFELAKNLTIIPAEGSADDALLALASKDTIICTNDKVLKEKIKRKGAPLIYLRQKKYLQLD
jgi:rRNA-processing protein FCF1